ncbi:MULTISPECIES: RNA polymerase sigma factor [unclassified Yoonia]|uniref:RNA polymerase sigma factor n=1 Tax=unclassified Yoonia TaxID=2629118 RepID=UPI002AFE9B9A|nr:MULTISPECIES: RNA polymerase sigma factor [unclassified Yoonia]
MKTDTETHPDPRDELVTHLPAMRAFATSLTRNAAAADDLVQDAVVKAWSNFDKFQPGTNLRAWLFTILRNTYYSLYRKRRREVEDPDGKMAGQLSEKPAHDGHLAMADFRVAFTKLTDEQREVLILIGAEGFSYEEAAVMCGCAVGTVKSRTNRARKRLAELMHIDDEDQLEMTDAATMAVVMGKPAA